MAKSNRARHLLTTYGITEAQYNEILKRQNNSCAICDRHRTEFNKNLSVDHNHKTGEIRGALCTYCNRSLVGRHTDPGLLRRIADYISQGTGWFVPKKVKSRKKRRRRRK